MSIQKIRNNTLGAFKNKKGFTLVEVIVVLVILAILAAILVPRLTGWITESKEKTATGEGHLVLSALQAAASEAYAEGTLTAGDGTALVSAANEFLEGDITLNAGTGGNISGITVDGTGGITGFTYEASNGKEITYNGSAFN